MLSFIRKKSGATSPSLAKNKFLKDKRGNTAIEFALILPLFLFLTFGIIEWSFYGYMRGQLENHIQQAMREVMTDNKQYYQTNNAGIQETREQFFDRLLKQAIKGSTFGKVDSVITKQNFQNAGGLVAGRSTSSGAGEANEFVRVTIISEYKFFTPMLGLLNNQINQMKMKTTVFIVNEAF